MVNTSKLQGYLKKDPSVFNSIDVQILGQLEQNTKKVQTTR